MKTNTPKLRFKEFTDEWQEKKIRDIACYSSNRITANELNSHNFVGVDSLISNLGGKIDSNYVPENGKVSRYSEGDILHSNIRPYLKKTWLANQAGGASADVLIIKPAQNTYSKLLYYLITSDNYFNYVMSGAKGVKMPRGDKIHIMNYKICVPDVPEQQKIAEFLMAVDGKIEKLETKKKAFEKYKKGVMQAIFSRKIRFKDSTGKDFPEWEENKLGEVAISEASTLSANTIVGKSGKFKVYGAAGIYQTLDKYDQAENYIAIVKDGAGVGRISFCEGQTSVLSTMLIIKARHGINPIFLFMLLQNIDLRKYITGSTIPHIYFRNFSKEMVEIPKYEEQEEIAEFLTALDNKVNLINKHLEQEKLFKKSLLQQMLV